MGATAVALLLAAILLSCPWSPLLPAAALSTAIACGSRTGEWWCAGSERFSGLTAALELRREGFEVVVLDKQETVGGRCCVTVTYLLA